MDLSPRFLRLRRSIRRGATCAAVAAAVLCTSPARADVLTLRDGRVIEGTVTRDGDRFRVVSRFGESEIEAKDVAEHVAGRSLEEEWRKRSAALALDDYPGRAALARWLFDAGRVAEGRAVAAQVVEGDPENALAHEVLGHVRHGGCWMTPDDAKRADGLEQHGDAWYTPEEWAALATEERRRVESQAAAIEGRRVNRALNEAAQLMLAPDPAVRAEGRRRLDALARETQSEAIAKAAESLAAYQRGVAAYMDAMTRGDSATVLGEFRIQLAKLKRPIQTFQTSLASNLGGAPISIQLPEVEIIKLNTTVGIPAAVK